ncbi:hypothetical protein BDY21DRAFT_268515, partial [Lineolata rhizophorae]
LLRTRTASFLSALVSPSFDPTTFLTTHFTPSTPRITEHGPPWAAASRLPFLGHTFAGLDGCLTYFLLLAATLETRWGEGTFPAGEDGVVVDAGASADGDAEEGEGGPRGVVCVVGKAQFASKRTGKAWAESFIYRLSGFDDEGRVGHWEIWADPLSAWEA